MNSKRIEREKRTVEVMIDLYCLGVHGETSLCAECTELRDYALQRLEKCPFGGNKPAGLSRAVRKPTCANCKVHCYNPEMRARVREVMRYAGPRMIIRYPLLALLHLWDGWRK